MSGKQHVDIHRKIMLRKNLLKETQGVIYVPFIGEGDIASEIYREFEIYGADINPARVETAKDRVSGNIITADCDKWPFPGVEAEFTAADFDAYSEPYQAFREFWEHTSKAKRVTMFFTDGHKQGIMRTGHWHKPDGSKTFLKEVNERRKVYNFYFPKHVYPWVKEFVKPYKITRKQLYLRGMLLYWGVVVENG